MRGAIKNVVALLGLLLLSVACGAKKLRGVDVGKKEDVSGADQTNFDRDNVVPEAQAVLTTSSSALRTQRLF